MSCSFIEMGAEDVRKLAQACLDGVLSYRRRLWAEAVEKERKRQERSWFRRLFRISVDTNDEIAKALKGRGSGINWLYISIEGSYEKSEKVATRLLIAAKHASVIQVSTADLEALGA